MSNLKLPKNLKRGPFAWMAINSVAANLLMLSLVIGGIMMIPSIKQEVFPQFELEIVVINVDYPGASPEEIEQGILLPIEGAVQAVDGIKEVRTTAREGTGIGVIELMNGIEPNRALADVKSAVDRITTFPKDVERPVVSLATNRSRVLSLVVYGDRSEAELRRFADQTRDDLIQLPEITNVELAAVRDLEVSIEVPRERLRQYGLTLEEIANRIRGASVDMPGGGVKTQSGEILIRTTERRDVGSEFEEVVLLSKRDGTTLRVGDIATVIDGFRDTDQTAYFNGQPAALVNVYRVGRQTPIEVSAAVRSYIKDIQGNLPERLAMDIWRDSSNSYRERMELLLRNAYLGLALVLLCLGLFMEIRLAFWVTLGIPISFVGSLVLLPQTDVSLNMISLFAYIVTLGIVVDDAIVVGEAAYRYREMGHKFLDAAILGVKEVATPVIFSILTTIVAFTPMLFVPGPSGKFFRVIPMIVILVLLLSLVESLLILPAHLGHGERSKPGGILASIQGTQQRFSNKLQFFIQNLFGPFLNRALSYRYVTIATGIGILILSIGLVAGGRVEFTFLPKIEGNRVSSTVTMPFGTAVSETRLVAERLEEALERTLEIVGDRAPQKRVIFSEVGSTSGGFGSPRGDSGSSGSHIAQITIDLGPAEKRSINARELSEIWRKETGAIAGVKSLSYRFGVGAGGSAPPVDVQLSHPQMTILQNAANKLAEELETFSGVRDIDNGFSRGKQQLDLRLKPAARASGITESMMARQLRHAFFGAEASRQLRGREEIRAYVRYPKSQRGSEFDIEEILLRSPQGGEIPLNQAATISRGRSYTSIRRINGRRAVNVTADTVPGVANENKIMGALLGKSLPKLQQDFPGLRYQKGGQQKSQGETLGSLKNGFSLAIIVIFGLLAVAFRSYSQPLIIMAAIPFGIIGAFIGHIIMGFDLSLISMMGIVALSGIVVNDSLILIVATNEYVREGYSAFEAIELGAKRRFRPIILTSLTTFFGLMPMILETSVQARFLIPMAISLGFGVLFATAIVLVLVPCVYLALDDFRANIFGLVTSRGVANLDSEESST